MKPAAHGTKHCQRIVALLARPERERHRAVRHRQRARRVAALVLRVVSDRRDRNEHAERGHGERVRRLVRRHDDERLAVDELRADEARRPAEERVTQSARAVEVVDRDVDRRVRGKREDGRAPPVAASCPARDTRPSPGSGRASARRRRPSGSSGEPWVRRLDVWPPAGTGSCSRRGSRRCRSR